MTREEYCLGFNHIGDQPPNVRDLWRFLVLHSDDGIILCGISDLKEKLAWGVSRKRTFSAQQIKRAIHILVKKNMIQTVLVGTKISIRLSDAFFLNRTLNRTGFDVVQSLGPQATPKEQKTLTEPLTEPVLKISADKNLNRTLNRTGFDVVQSLGPQATPKEQKTLTEPLTGPERQRENILLYNKEKNNVKNSSKLKINILVAGLNKILLKEVTKVEVQRIGNKFLSWAFAFFDIWYSEHPNFVLLNKAKLEDWANVVRLMIEQDNRTTDELKTVYRFLKSPKGHFWFTTIYSIEGLRRNFDSILISIEKSKGVPESNSEVIVAKIDKDNYLNVR